MKIAVVFSPKAEADIDEIYDYTSASWGYEKADSYIFGLRDTVDMIASGRRRGKAMPDFKRDYLALAFQAHFII